MTELIKVNYDSGKPLVSGRELHEALGIETPYHKWFPRMCEYGFTEDKDFWTKMSESTGGRPSTDHDKSRGIAALVVDYFKNDDNRRAFEQWHGGRRRANRHELHEEPALEVSQAR